MEDKDVSVNIPQAAQQQHIAILGKTGSGKTWAAKTIVEGWLATGRRVGIVDPTSAWWGLRSSRDGKGAGFPILVLGGDHGDLPLPALGGAAVARLLVRQGVNLVADTSALTVGERTRWFIDFAHTVYRENRGPLHLVIDEAHNFAPQGKVPDPDTGKMLHAANTLASGGRSRGIRLVMVTQRPQKLHKDALTSADTLIAMRVLAPHDRLAVEDWIKGCGDLAQGREVLNSLASLQRGEGWVWYPEGGFLHRMKFPDITTFDSSATPTDGDVTAIPKGAAELDLTEIRAAMAEAVKEAEANDPRLLRAKIAELEREARKPHELVVDVEALERERRAGKLEGYREAIRALLPMVDRMQTLRTALDEQLGGLIDDLGKWRSRFESGPLPENPTPSVATPTPRAAASRDTGRQIDGSGPTLPLAASNGALPRAERLILTTLAQYPAGRTKVQVAILTGYAVGGGGFSNAISALRTKGFLAGDAARLTATRAGVSALGSFEPLPSGQALLAHWLGQLGKAERKALETLAEAYPRTLSKVQLANRAGYEPNGGGFNNALSRLRTLELISGRAELKASDALFD